MKTCGGCSRTLPLTAYNKDKGRWDGLQPRCRDCDLEKKRAYREANREKIRQQARELYAANPERIREQKRAKYAQNREKEVARVSAYNKANREKRREYEKAAYAANPERKKTNVKDWQKKNPHKKAKNAAARRMRVKKANTFAVTKREWDGLLSKPCTFCGSKQKITVDHIIPLARGGRHSIGNLQTLCHSCNASKGAKLLAEWRHARTVNSSANAP